MISGAISKNGLGHLIMHGGNINTFVYKQSLNFYKEDIDNLGTKLFQQDGGHILRRKLRQYYIIYLAIIS